MVASRLALMPGTVSITATSCRAYGFGFVQPSPGLSKGSHCQGVPVQASVPVDGEQKPSNAQLEALVTRLPANRWWPKNRDTPEARPLSAALSAPVTFAVASDSILPSGCWEPVKITGLPKPVSA